jgi:hypothetical protein
VNWEAQLIELVTLLTANAVTTAAGSMARAMGIIKPSAPPDWLVNPITRSAQDNVRSMLAAISDMSISQTSLTRTCQALRSVEAQGLERSLVIESLAQKSQEPGAVRAQLLAILTYVGHCNRDDAKLLLPILRASLSTARSRRGTPSRRHLGGTMPSPAS